jgi:transposase InsO family protein
LRRDSLLIFNATSIYESLFWCPENGVHHSALDNVFIERLWRSLKYELIYPGDFATGLDLFPALQSYFHFYNYQRPHQALGYQTPADLFPHRFKRQRSFL